MCVCSPLRHSSSCMVWIERFQTSSWVTFRLLVFCSTIRLSICTKTNRFPGSILSNLSKRIFAISELSWILYWNLLNVILSWIRPSNLKPYATTCNVKKRESPQILGHSKIQLCAVSDLNLPGWWRLLKKVSSFPAHFEHMEKIQSCKRRVEKYCQVIWFTLPSHFAEAADLSL